MRKEAAKQALKVGDGAMSPCSPRTTLAVKPLHREGAGGSGEGGKVAGGCGLTGSTAALERTLSSKAAFSTDCTAPDEVVHRLLPGQLGYGGKHAKGVAAQHDDVLGVAAHAGDLGVGCMEGWGICVNPSMKEFNICLGT